MKKVFLAIPTVGSNVDSQLYVLREIADLYKDHFEFVYPKQCVRRMFHDYARNEMVKEFLASDCEVLWFLDSDVTPNKFIGDLIALHWDKWSLAGATYPVFMTPPGEENPQIVFTAYRKNPETGNLAVTSVPQSGKEMIDGLATGCLFIKREVFEKLELPYFEFKYEKDTRNMIEGEDLGFCRKVNALGYQFFVDYSLCCKHEKKIDLLDLNNYAIMYSNRSILEYDRRIKESVQPALKAQYDRGYRAALDAIKGQLESQNNPVKPSSTLWTPSFVKSV